MDSFEALIVNVFADRDLSPDEIPRLDLYMDQVLTLFEDGFSAMTRNPEDKLLTKTMVNNYSKEKLLLPLKGKKYSRQQIMQLLCICMLKQELSLQDIRSLTCADGIDFEACYHTFLQKKERIREFIPPELSTFAVDLNDPSQRLSLCLSLTAVAAYMRRLCEAIIDAK